ncbi:MAG: hypothetical protein JRN20_17915 [Nitrososphaerota archaeon]|nr:hypothetical protein [Nitrososphaerota archaeon]
MTKEIKVILDRVLGAASVFRQGGSLRLILPKKAFRSLKMSNEAEDFDNTTVILIVTNKGIILRRLDDYLQDEEMKGI